LAVVWATESHRTLLLGNPFTLETDHSALKQLLADKASVGRLAWWSLKLQEFDMVVKYRKGTTLGAADFMSRIQEGSDGKLVVAAVKPGVVEGEEPPGTNKARAKVYLEVDPPNPQDAFLNLRDFEVARSNCPWILALRAFVLKGVPEGKIFTQMDLYSELWQIPMTPEDIEKTAFTSPLGLYEWIVIPFGLMNAPATFQAIMEKVLEPVLWKTCAVYIDDLVIFLQTEEEHLEHLAEVLKLLDETGLRMKVDKCQSTPDAAPWFRLSGGRYEAPGGPGP
jgi:hypothetical protein